MAIVVQPYEYTEPDYEYLQAVAETISIEGYISEQLIPVAQELLDKGAAITAEEVAELDQVMKSLSKNFVEISNIKVRMLDIYERANDAKVSILRYSPDELARQANIRKDLYSTLQLNFSNAIDTSFSDSELKKFSANVMKSLAVLGEAVGPVYDTLKVLENFNEGNDYAGLSGTASGILGVDSQF